MKGLNTSSISVHSTSLRATVSVEAGMSMEQVVFQALVVPTSSLCMMEPPKLVDEPRLGHVLRVVQGFNHP